jgi:hypothetical protein
MIFFLTSHSLWLSGAIVVGLGTALSMLGARTGAQLCSLGPADGE